MKKCLLEECETLTNNPKFCSLSHGAIHQNRIKPRIKYEEVKVCINESCYEEFTVTSLNKDKSFCGHSCAAKTLNATRERKWDSKKECGYLGCTSMIQGKSSSCQPCLPKIKLDLWKSGSWGRRSEYLSVVIRNHLLAESSYGCSICGFNTRHPDGSTVLQIDHVNGDGYDHSPENLRVLCPNCHSLTPNFGGRNRGNGRAYRYLDAKVANPPPIC